MSVPPNFGLDFAGEKDYSLNQSRYKIIMELWKETARNPCFYAGSPKVS